VFFQLIKDSVNYNFLLKSSLKFQLQPLKVSASPATVRKALSGIFRPNLFRIKSTRVLAGISTAAAIKKLMYGFPPRSKNNAHESYSLGVGICLISGPGENKVRP